MEEIINITQKYQPSYIEESFRSLGAMHVFSAQFVKDVADLYDALTRIKNVERNSSGFSFDDAPIAPFRQLVSVFLGFRQVPRCAVSWEHPISCLRRMHFSPEANCSNEATNHLP